MFTTIGLQLRYIQMLGTESKRYGEKKSEWTVPYPDVARWVRTVTVSGGRDDKLGLGRDSRRHTPERVSRMISNICLPFLTFQTLYIFCFVIFKTTVLNVLVSVVAVLI